MESFEYEYRVEIICNQSVQDDLVDFLEQEIPDLEYTVIPEIQGKGMTSKKLGNTTWPEKNFVLFAYTNLSGAKKIKESVLQIKKRFPNEGISVFFTKGTEV